MGNDQTKIAPLRLPKNLCSSLRTPIFVESAKDLIKLPVASCRYRKNELQIMIPHLDLTNALQVIQRKKPTIRYQHHTLYGVQFEDFLNSWYQCFGLSCVALKQLVVDRQSICGLHHAEHDLSVNAPFLGETILADLVIHFGLTLCVDGGEVIKDDG